MICIERHLCIVSLISVGLAELWLLALHQSTLLLVRGSPNSPLAHFSFRHHRHRHLPLSYNITLCHNRAKWWPVSKFSVNTWSTIYLLQHGPYSLFSNCAWSRHSYWSTTVWLLLPYCLSQLILLSCQLWTHCDQLRTRRSNSKCQQLWGNLFVRLLIRFFVAVDLIQLHQSEIKGVGYWIWGWLVELWILGLGYGTL
jgi:hypothetical protein